jgi:zinc transport system substrate-binding protein
MRIVLMTSVLHRLVTVTVAAVAGLALGGCGTAAGPDGGAAAAGGTGALRVVASFYPLQYVAQRVGGDAVRVDNLTRPGAEPHDLELSPRDVATVSDADLVVYLAGFQPAVDDVVAAQATRSGLDVTPAARLDPAGGDTAPGADPHFWLDPTRLADVADAVAGRLEATDPGRGPTFRANAAALRGELATLDAELTRGLSTCTNRELVTGHEAFGYLAARYGLTQVGITGLSPEAEPDAATIARVSDVVRAHSVRTIYSETLVAPDVARTVAAETGARTAVLDPVEGISDASAAPDYLGVMRANLAGQPCP